MRRKFVFFSSYPDSKMQSCRFYEKIDGVALIAWATGFRWPPLLGQVIGSAHREGGACIHEHYKEALMSKRGRKRKDRRKGGANHGKRPNA